MHKPERFEKFYFAKVGLGEACGCAEKVIDVYEFNRKGGSQATGAVQKAKPRHRSLRSFALKYGLISRARR
ncbi:MULTISPECIES: hypothetical protein [unclassified Ruegeria]|uniref:hypothetical protein n=1 Tax=unclassified Ruegeria TaxID=2625375 RepID=UPI0014885B4D|nr:MULTISPECIES: hypothetical protein [unclassified Ruegeria]